MDGIWILACKARNTNISIKSIFTSLFIKDAAPGATPDIPTFMQGECKFEQLKFDFIGDGKSNLKPFLEYKKRIANSANQVGLF